MPLYRWDVDRILGHREPQQVTGQHLANDRRFCWAGRSMYGLYRHGLLPGARDLGTVAGSFIHASDTSIGLDELHFVLRYVGYRYTYSSLRSAVMRAEDFGMFGTFPLYGGWLGRAGSESQQREVARALGFARRGPLFYAAIGRAQKQVRSALAERGRRLNGR